MNDDKLSLYIADKIKTFRKEKNMTQTDLAEKLGVSKQTISKYEKAKIKAHQNTLFQLVDIFDVSIDDFFPSRPNVTTPTITPSDLLTTLNDKANQLTNENQKKASAYISKLLTEQLGQTIEEPQTLYDVDTVSRLAAGFGFGYDDNDIETYQVTNEPPRFDVASVVDGDSMLPDYENGDIVYLVDKGFSRYSGQVCAVVVDDKTYLKRVYTEPNGFQLRSINPEYWEKDKFIDFPPAGDTHIKIFTVVGSDKPI